MGWRTKLALAAVALLGVLWIKGHFGDKGAQREQDLEAQASAAIVLAQECKLDDARSGLQALDQAKGTPQQHARVQQAIKDAAPGCAKQLRRDAAWADAKVAVARALDSRNYDRAYSIIKNFTSRWSNDDASQALRDNVTVQHVNSLLEEADTCLKSGNLDCVNKNLVLAQTLDQGSAKSRIAGLQADLGAARERQAPNPVASQDAPAVAAQPVAASQPPAITPRIRPAPIPAAAAPAAPASGPDPRLMTLVSDAVRRMREGNYRGAEDLMNVCVSLDPGNQRCQELRQRADQMNRTMLSCVASGKQWANERCD